MEGLSGFTFFRSFHEALEDMDDEMYGQCVRMLSEYAFNDIVPNVTGGAKMFWVIIKPILDSSIKTHFSGRQGGLKGKGITRNSVQESAPTQIRKGQKGSQYQEEREEEVKENGNERKMVKIQKIPPDLSDVEAYCQERGNGIDAQRFIDFYTASGWKRGNTAIKDWKACVRTWEQKNGKFGANAAQNKGAKTNLGVGEFIAGDGTRRYGTGNLPPVPMEAPPRPDKDSVWSAESKTWIQSGL